MIKETNINEAFVIEQRQAIGAIIKAKRIAKGMNQKEVGDALGVALQTISKIEAGKFPTAIDTYIKIGVVLELKLLFLQQ